MPHGDVGPDPSKEPTDQIGLGHDPRREWPRVTPGVSPIDILHPGGSAHALVKSYLLDRLEHSEHEMARFHARWQVNEKKHQAYIDLPDWEKTLKNMNDSGKPPKIIPIVVPYNFAITSTIVTFLMHTFGGRKPMFQVGTYKDETVENARRMEVVLQYNADHARLLREAHKFFQDTQIYSVGVFLIKWVEEEALRTVWSSEPQFDSFGGPLPPKSMPSKEVRTIYAGNQIFSQDPFLFFPDPRVPMTEVNRRGEYVFWRTFEGRHILKRLESTGELKWVDYAAERTVGRSLDSGSVFGDESVRSLLAGGHSIPGRIGMTNDMRLRGFLQVDQGSVDIIPRELGLGESEEPEKWIFTILNKDQIVQAAPLDYDHGMHPVGVSEPYTMGYGFGNPGLDDYIGPIQDSISWLVNSRSDNVRKALNDMFIVDPSMVEMQDLRNPAPGRLIRLKRSAYGQDVRNAVQQFPVVDVTGSHISDIQQLVRLGEMISGVNQNLLGQSEDTGSRKTATEVRTTGEAAASRLAALARIVSAQAIVDLTEQMSINNQQFLRDDFFITIVGQQGHQHPIHIAPEQLVGDFYYPINDGTLPLDRVALTDVWKEIFSAMLQDQELRQRYDIGKVFEFIADLGGAKNIEQMRTNVQPTPQGQIDAGVQQGNLVPVPGPNGAAGPAVPSSALVGAVTGSPARRIGGALA